ncbi:APC family permease [Catenulispora pinisilvae]|uniref:APC family permease n=1 Tax=Catenulispora pinisilvae TaxID=2705253 RepID=UPI00189277DE|nr:amino acid permease [Catenulispora pinisilvae]
MITDSSTSPAATAPAQLTRHIGRWQGTALYVSAILGAGVLVLPGQVASMAGPASLLSWAFACVLGVPLAWMFAAFARRFPEAGGVATYVGRAFGPTAGALTGWLYFAAGSFGQTIVPLTGGYYVAQALNLGSGWAYLVAVAILTAAVAANLHGRRVSARTQLALAAAVAVALVLTTAAAAPHMSVHRLHPFAPHGLGPVADGVIVLFFAFAGWEAVAHLAEEFTDPDRDVPRAVAATIAIVSVLYLGIAAAVVLTGTYGDPHTDHVAIGLLLRSAFGPGANIAAAVIAVLISLGTANAFIASVSRLGYSLARDRWLPHQSAYINRRSVPVGGIVTVAAIAYAGLAAAAGFRWGTETLVVVPSTLVVTVYLLAAAAGIRLLRGVARGCAVLTVCLTALVIPDAARHVVIPVLVVSVALLTRWLDKRPA